MRRKLSPEGAQESNYYQNRLSVSQGRVLLRAGPSAVSLAPVLCAILVAVSLTGCADRNVDLFAACEKGDVDRIQGLLDRGAHVNARSRNGETPLMIAAGLLHPDAVQLLIARGANVNAENTRGDTALALALAARAPEGAPEVESDRDKVVALLVRHGATR